MRTMRVARLSSAIVAPTFVASALGGCAPVGPNFVSAGRDRFSRNTKRSRLEDRHAAAERAERANGWTRVPRSGARPAGLFAVTVSNQTVKADEANYRQALAPIDEARAGLFPTVSANGSATHSSPAIQHQGSVTNLTGGIVGRLDPRRVGAGEARDRVEGGRSGGERGQSRQRDARAASGARARLRAAERGGFARRPARRRPSTSTSVRSRSPRTSTTPARRPSPTSSPRRRRCSTPRPS